MTPTEAFKAALSAWGVTVTPEGKMTCADGRALKAKWEPVTPEEDIRKHSGNAELELVRLMLDEVLLALFEKKPTGAES